MTILDRFHCTFNTNGVTGKHGIVGRAMSEQYNFTASIAARQSVEWRVKATVWSWVRQQKISETLGDDRLARKRLLRPLHAAVPAPQSQPGGEPVLLP